MTEQEKADEADARYRVRTTGRVAGDRDPKEVVAAVAKRFRLPEAKARRLVARPTAVGKATTEAKARTLKRVLFSLGVLARVEKEEDAPAATPAASGPAEVDRGAAVDALVANLRDDFARPARPLSYYLRAAVVVLLCLFAPLLYFGLLGADLYAFVLWLRLWPQPSGLWSFVVWVTVPLTLGVLALVMLRPLLRRTGKLGRIRVTEEQQPALFRLLDALCARVGVPRPEAVYVDSSVNAYVNPARGLRDLAGRRLELTIGIPLVLGMDGRQLASVIAHEFGHFAQNMEMFVYHVVNRINGWMWSCGWFQDPWQDRLIGWRTADPTGIAWLPCTVALLAIDAVRWLMRVLVWLNALLTRRFSQELEFDADRHAVALVGSAPFVASEHRLRELVYAWHEADSTNARVFHERRQLLDDLPSAIVTIHGGYDAARRRQIEVDGRGDETHSWDTHPAGAERFVAAEALEVPAVEAGDFPGEWLIEDAAELGQRATLLFYRGERGIRQPKELVVANAEVLSAGAEQDASFRAIDAFFLDRATRRLLAFRPPDSAELKVLDAPGVRDRLWEGRERFEAAGKRYHEQQGRADALFLASTYAASDIGLAPGTFGIDPSIELSNLRAVDRALETAVRAQRAAGRELADFDALFCQRALLAAATLSAPERTRLEALTAWLGRLAVAAEPLEEMARCRMVILSMQSIEDEALSDHLLGAVQRQRDICVQTHDGLLRRIEGEADPISPQEGATVGAFLAADGIAPLGDPAVAQPPWVAERSTAFEERLLFLYFRVLGEVARLALGAEQAQREAS